jgi:hypothetical protein
MLLYPKGELLKDIADPDRLTDEFRQASKIAAQTTQYQWHKDTFDSPVDLEPGPLVQVRTNTRNPLLSVTNTVAMRLVDAQGTTPDADLFQIPYNQGFAEITDTDVEWTSQYVELVWIIFSFQYVRARAGSGAAAEGEKPDILPDPTNKQIRAQLKVSIDGTLYDGSGPFAVPYGIDSTYRGAGYRNRSLASSVCVLQMLPPGTHRVVGMAAQAPDTKVEDGINSATVTYKAYPPVQGVCVANGRMLVVSFAQGGRMGA